MKFSTYLRLAASLAASLILASCGGGGGGSDNSAPAAPAVPVVTLSLSPSSVLPGQESTLTWLAANASSCTGAGAWSGSKAVAGSVKVSQASSGSYGYGLTCTGSGGTASNTATLTVSLSTSNVVPMSVHSGPLGNSFNAPMVSVTICQPGTAYCQTIDNILVDTGSYGLRIIAAGGLSAGLNAALPQVTNASGNVVAQCAQFVSGYTWGSVRRADVKMGGELASNLPIQIIGDTDASYGNVPADCSNVGANMGTVAAMGANGILGVGLFKEDCGPVCANQVIPGFYYGCSGGTCTGTQLAVANQVSNPVSSFAINNNGVVMTLPSVPSGGSVSATGSLIFGIGTQDNNQLGTATVYAANLYGNFKTTYKGQTYTESFIDSGSNGLFFPDASIPSCPAMGGWFCPGTPLTLSAVNTAYNNSASGTVSFLVESPADLYATSKAGHIGADTSGFAGINGFDWGLPFFLGRKVFTAVYGSNTPAGPGPYWAY